MIESMHPVPGKIFNYKSDNDSKPDRLQLIDSHMLNEPGITDDCKAKLYTITERIGGTGA